ncbi:fimbria major subunit [uncultured Porphyromonas sp.]|uniref:fimbria major subunit n=1 Tax=uncultured Porphyromonas sp. TaxID=159274 RepID=UPI00262E03B5|nr:fimbria major subunit [uncultured Porphyromonas sp.]
MEKPGDGSSFATRYAYSPGYLEIAKSDQSNQKALFKAFRVANEKNSIFNLESLRLIPKSVDDCDLTQQVYYTSETTIDPDHHTYYFLPAVLIGYKLYPASLDAIGDFKSDEGWVSFNGRYYRGRDFVTYLKAIYERNKATGNPKPLVTIPEGYPKELQDVCEDYVATLDDKMLIRAYPGELYPIDYKGLRYYLRSYNYYYLPVQHAPSQERYGHYGIVRNNDYRIEITSISDFGTPLLMNPADHPDKYVPKQPITATLTLTPLEERDNTANL